MDIKVGTILTCGCCGMDFQTWEGYIDQDQDVDYGICVSCQDDLEIRNEAEIDKIIEAIREKLNESNLIKFNGWPRDKQKIFALNQLDKGNIQFQVVPR